MFRRVLWILLVCSDSTDVRRVNCRARLSHKMNKKKTVIERVEYSMTLYLAGL